MKKKIDVEELPVYKELADHLGVSEQAVKQYPKEKRRLMLIGLKFDSIAHKRPIKYNTK